MTRVWQRFQRSTKDGSPLIELEHWVLTLPEDEKKLFFEAQANQKAYRQQAIDRGDMILSKQGGYIWRDQETASKGKQTDQTWLRYFERWIKECNIEFNIQVEEIE